ncbi:hypothetical protein MKX01_029214 [Papaver californicum]|nr:hypothetical protein MKX01_029214 [Papaver californicum]
MQLKAYTGKHSKKLLFNMVDYEMTINDEFQGARFWWMLSNSEEIGTPRKTDTNESVTLTFILV